VTRVQADVVKPIADWLDARLPTAEARLNVPAKWTPADGPLLVVADDGGPTRWPIKSDHTIRLTGWAAGRDEARGIVALAAGLLAGSNPRPPGVAYVDPEMGTILDARDKTTGAMLASILIGATARTVEV
jgi:hypothetical protein